MKFSSTVFLAIWMLQGTGCERHQPDKQNSAASVSHSEDQKGIRGEGESQSLRRQMGDYTYVHLVWFYDKEIARQFLSRLEEDGIRAVSESEVGVISVWVIERREADGIRVLQSNPDWMAARVKGVTGCQAKTKQ
jgi:hypothetical protein